jgi:hypothetical protein
VLGATALAVMTVGVVATLALVNSHAPPPPPLISIGVAIGAPGGIAAENERLAREGARIRVVALRQSCQTRANPHPRRLTRVDLSKVRDYSIVQPPAGETAVAVASEQRLTGLSFLVQGRVPSCLLVTGQAPYRE